MEWPTPLAQQETEYMMPNQFSRDRHVLPDPVYYAQNFMTVVVPVAEHMESNSQAQGDSSSDTSFPPPVPSQVSQRSRRKLEQIVLTTAVKNDKAQVRLEGGEIEFPCTKIPSYFRFKIGDRFRARVTYDGERPTSAVFDKRM
jgi:hypothetical protein